MEQPIINLIKEILSGKTDKKNQQKVDEHLAEVFENNKWTDDLGSAKERKTEILNAINSNIRSNTYVKRKLYVTLFKVAAVLIVTVFVGYHISKNVSFNPQLNNSFSTSTFSSNVPGLTTSNGDYKQLREMKIGQLFETPLFSIERLSQRQFCYISKPNIGNKSLVRIITDSNESYQVILADKSIITLDANSELIFPSEFAKDSRELVASGKLFFDVKKDSARPFSVSSETIKVMVKGTSFVFNAAVEKENSFVALIEGSLQMKTTNSQILLKPGQKGSIKEDYLSVDRFDLDETIAFENNEFFFQNQPISYIMNEIARWYNMDLDLINFDKAPDKLTIKINRNKPLNEVLNIIKTTGNLNITIEERRIIVRKVNK